MHIECTEETFRRVNIENEPNLIRTKVELNDLEPLPTRNLSRLMACCLHKMMSDMRLYCMLANLANCVC